MKKTLISTMALALVSGNIYAHGVQVLGSEKHSSPGIQLHVESHWTSVPYNPAAGDDKKKVFDRTLDSMGNTRTKVDRASGRVGENIRLSSSHEFTICNGEKYAAYYNTSSELRDQFGHNGSNSDHTLVMANSCATNTTNLYFYNEYREPGTFRLDGYSDVGGAMRSSDWNNIDVSR